MSILRQVEQETLNGGNLPVVVVEGLDAGRLVRELTASQPGVHNRVLAAPTRRGAMELARLLHEEHLRTYKADDSPYRAVIDQDYDDEPREERPARRLWLRWPCHEIENAFLVPEDLAAVHARRTADVATDVIRACRDILPLAAVNFALSRARATARVVVSEFSLRDLPKTVEEGCASKYADLEKKRRRRRRITENALLDWARAFEAKVGREIGLDALRPVPPQMPGKEVLDLFRRGLSIARTDLLLRVVLQMKARGYFPREIRETLAAAGVPGPP